jgi:hypothetical protein
VCCGWRTPPTAHSNTEKKTLLGIGYFGVDGEVLHSSGLERGSVEGIYKNRYETLGFIEARSLIYEQFVSGTLVTHNFCSFRG